MKQNRQIRYVTLGVILLLGVYWCIGSAAATSASEGYPNSQFLADAAWLATHIDDEGVVVVDVRTEEHFDGTLIDGAIRLPWSNFRYNDLADNVASTFVGADRAQEILGKHGIARSDTIIIYDSVERDGGATSSYVFWVLDLLGHENKRILNGGIDAWIAAGGKTVSESVEREALLYQAPAEELDPSTYVEGTFIYQRLGDPYYQILDVRSREEYLGEKGTKDARGNPLKLGHIPTAVNIEYTQAWVDEESKKLKSYAELQDLYRGLDPDRSVIVYCNSGRRSSFSYFVLRLMGFERVHEYEKSWKQWGLPGNFFPVETQENVLTSQAVPGATQQRVSSGRKTKTSSPEPAKTGGEPGGGYVSCGG